jgi:pyrroline-5-carboxylate reductase
MRVGLIGAGNMARALARGWGDPVLASDGGSGRAAALAAELGGQATDNASVAAAADVVVLCHKPYQLAPIAEQIRSHARIIISVLAATPADLLRAAYPEQQLFRLIPNTPVELRRGITVYAPIELPDYTVDAQLEAEVVALFARVGQVVTVPERLLGVAAAVSSVGPAYQALLAEAQVDAAVRRGLPAGMAAELVTATMAGAAGLIERRDHDTLRVRREVTSPGGTTARGLDALERGGVRAAFQAAIDRVLEVAS